MKKDLYTFLHKHLKAHKKTLKNISTEKVSDLNIGFYFEGFDLMARIEWKTRAEDNPTRTQAHFIEHKRCMKHD